MTVSDSSEEGRMSAAWLTRLPERGLGGRIKRRPERHDQILTVAAVLFNRQGFKNTSMEDIAQEVFLKTWKSIYRYNPESSKFKTWILRIARNTAIDYLRKRKHIPFSEFSSTRDEEDGGGANLLADVIPDPNPLPEELFARTEDAEMVIHSVEMLSPRHREVLTLHYTNHLTFEEIGRMLGQPTNTVKSRHHRALIALRTLLAPKDHE